jgi:hypothetical protein
MNKCTLATSLLLWTVFIAMGKGQTLVDLRTQSKSVDFSGAASTKPMQTGSSLPTACAVGQFFFLTTASAGSGVYACNPANTWSVEGNNLSVNSGTANEVLSSNGSGIEWLALGGDVSGAPGGLTVGRLQGRNLSGTAPSSGQVLQWNAAANQWQPAPAEAGNAAYAFVAQVSITIPGTVHQFGTVNLVVGCYDNSTPPQLVEPDKIQISPTTYNVTVDFSTAQTGYCVVNGAGTASVGGSGGGAVTSVFGRTGAVTSQAGDYNFGQISGAASSSQLPSAGGDLSGSLTSATVKAIQGQPVSSTFPSNGQALVWNSGAGAWQASNVSGGGGGVTMAYQLGDLATVYTSPTVLTIGAGCGPSSPCNVRFGYQVYSIMNSATVTISGTGLGTAYIYVNDTGTLTVGNNLTVVCSAGCVQQAGITSFPPNVLPVYTWTATNGVWNSTGGTDQRAFLSSKTLAGGQGIIITEAPGQSTLAVDNGVIPTYLMNAAILNFPAIATGTCAADQTLTVAGANPGDAVAPGWPALPAGVFGLMLVSAANTVTVRLCNLSGFGVTPPSATYRATIVRNY